MSTSSLESSIDDIPKRDASKKRKAPDFDSEPVAETKKSKHKESSHSKDKKHKKDKKDKKKKDKKDKKERKEKEKRKKDKKERKAKKLEEAKANEAESASSSDEEVKKSSSKRSSGKMQVDDAQEADTFDSSYGHAGMSTAARKAGVTMSTENLTAGNMLDAVKARKSLLWGPKPTATEKAASGPSPTPSGRNDWSKSMFASTSEKSKFMRLMGAKDVEVKEEEVGKDEAQESMFSQLASQYDQAMKLKKQSYGNKKKGL